MGHPRVTPERWGQHPAVARHERYVTSSDKDRASLWRLIDAELTVKKRRDLVVDGYGYRKLCFVEEGFAARYKLLRNGKRQIVNFVLPGDVVGLPGSFLKKARYFVIAVTDLKLQLCSINAYVHLCYTRPQFALALSWLWQFPDAAILCSRTLLTAAHFGRVRDLDAIFDFGFYDSGNPTKSTVRIWLAAELEWEDRLVIQFRFSNLANGPFEGEDDPAA
jgi:Cyclic nucleotide-binding domain